MLATVVVVPYIDVETISSKVGAKVEGEVL